MMISTPSPLLNRFDATPVISPLCQKPPSPMIAIGRLSMFGVDGRGARERHAVAEDRVAQRNGAKVANEWQPMSALIWVGPSSRCISLIAENTGRSGQPVQKVGGRGGSGPSAAAAFALCAIRPARLFRDGVGVDAGRLARPAGTPQGPRAAHRRCIRRPAAAGPCRARACLMSARRSSTLTACSM